MIARVALALSVLLTQACAECPSETSTSSSGSTGSTGSTGSGGQSYADPCDEGGPYADADYTDGSLETIRRGGTVRADGTAEQSIVFDSTVATIVRVLVRVVPAHHSTIAGTALPAVDLRRNDDAGEREIGSATDQHMVAANYNEPHDLVIDIGDHQEAVDDDAPGTRYIVGVTGESGPGARDMRICGTRFVTNSTRR